MFNYCPKCGKKNNEGWTYCPFCGVDLSEDEKIKAGFFIHDGILVRYNGKEINVVIPEKVTEIDEIAFFNSGITSVVIPDGVKTIGGSAFRYCGYLKEIDLPDTVKTIGDCAFYNCASVLHVKIGSGLTDIGKAAFYGCKSIKSFEVNPQNTCFSSDGGILYDKTGAEIIKAPEGLEIEGFTIPEGVLFIGETAFAECKNLKSVIIPDGVKAVCDGAFLDCSDLERVVIGNDVSAIGKFAFHGTALKSVIVSEDCILGENAFPEGCEVKIRRG